MTALDDMGNSLRKMPHRLAQFFYSLAHNGFALFGLFVILCLLALAAHSGWRRAGEAQLMDWLQTRQFGEPLTEPSPLVTVGRATATDLQTLSAQQAAVTDWLSRRYRVAPQPLSALVLEAYQIGHNYKLDPLLLLSVMAIESGFNPFAQSPVGAQGLMQVMTHLHGEKYEPFGGQLAAFDPLTNLHVGARVLREYIMRSGSVEGGLRRYVGAANLPSDGGYVTKVLSEHHLLTLVARRAQTVPDVPKPAVRARTMQVTMPAPARQDAAATHASLRNDLSKRGKQTVALLND
ncbi:lytic transglycosylase domain-containing protein [Hylemonella gracilis]|uniref:Lytic transglycosylase domain-containing protein n=1 Tax=Hylemonella gracilis TaxID=80880 RepID=A0A4P6ULU2_9BURK|nr:lytic transglycosylase domain-containing protein [Hylemonella gracilis]QBK05047.1 lytic transglycosylase domain-containing protein [Hylemonella gracilis]